MATRQRTCMGEFDAWADTTRASSDETRVKAGFTGLIRCHKRGGWWTSAKPPVATHQPAKRLEMLACTTPSFVVAAA